MGYWPAGHALWGWPIGVVGAHQEGLQKFDWPAPPPTGVQGRGDQGWGWLYINTSKIKRVSMTKHINRQGRDLKKRVTFANLFVLYFKLGLFFLIT